MKNKFRFLGFVAIAAIMTFTFAFCDNGYIPDTTNEPDNTPVGTAEVPSGIYTGTRYGATYTLTIYQSKAKAVHAEGDDFALAIKRGDTEKTSSGKLVGVAGSTFSAQPSYEDAKIFTITINDTRITSISGSITFSDASTEQGPGSFSSGGGGGGGGATTSPIPQVPQVPQVGANRDALLELIFINENVDYDSLSDLEKIRHIRDWLIQNLPIANDPVNDMPLMEVLELYLIHERGVYCWGSSYFFAKICNELGFGAVTISMGINPIATHAMTLIRIQYEGNPLLVLFDAFIGLEFFDEDGSIASFEAMLLALKNEDNTYFYEINVAPDWEKYDLQSNTYCDLGIFTSDSTKLLESIASLGYKESIFSYLLLPFGIDGDNENLSKEVHAFYRDELGISF